MKRIRKLKLSDAEFMREWMSDYRVNQYFSFAGKTFRKEDCEAFIKNTEYDKNNVHFAIVDDNDNYAGTVSLKDIDEEAKKAEFAIGLRYDFQGKGYGKQSINEILNYGFTELGLERIYLNVLSDNEKAISLYEKCGFSLEGIFSKHMYVDGKIKDLRWYGIDKNKFFSLRNGICKEIEFKEFGDHRGKLVALESNKDIPFLLRRIFYIYGCEGKAIRGCHANKYSSFLMVSVSGSCIVKYDNGIEKREVLLDSPKKALYLGKMVWKEMYNFSDDCVLMVMSDYDYDSKEYINDYEDFLRQVK